MNGGAIGYDPMAHQMAVWRRESIGRLPWVTVLKRKVPCEGVIHSKVSKNRPKGSPGTVCSRQAGWRYAALPTSLGRTGRYCLSHLLSEGMADMAEHDRVNRYIDRHPEMFGPSPRAQQEARAAAADDLVLHLDRDEDLAVVLALIPEWAELAEGLDLSTEDGRDTYRRRLQALLDERIEGLAAESAALRSLPEGG